MKKKAEGRGGHGWYERGARDFDPTGSGVMRALQSLGYDAQSLDYDRRFIDAVRDLAPDVVFNALHGPGGEDGQVQAMLEYLGIPFTGGGMKPRPRDG